MMIAAVMNVNTGWPINVARPDEHNVHAHTGSTCECFNNFEVLKCDLQSFKFQTEPNRKSIDAWLDMLDQYFVLVLSENLDLRTTTNGTLTRRSHNKCA